MALLHKQLLSVLDYDKATGVFRWLVTHHRIRAGDVAGYINNKTGYAIITIERKLHLAHRLAWFWITGKWPTHTIDHKNRVRSDNRFSNLRQATGSENRRNLSLTTRNRSGFKGVCMPTGRTRWRAQIHARRIGDFDLIEDAAIAFNYAAAHNYGQFANLNAITGWTHD